MKELVELFLITAASIAVCLSTIGILKMLGVHPNIAFLFGGVALADTVFILREFLYERSEIAS